MNIDKVTSYKDLIVWQKVMNLVVLVYELTKLFPAEEKYGLVSQMRRCLISVPSNIAEGWRRGATRDI
jgi:four helix bundle protein